MKGALRAQASQHSAHRTLRIIQSDACRLSASRSRSQLGVRCQAVRFPAALPMLPYTPQELMPPGSCKVLRLYDSSKYMLLLEELMSSPHKMLVHTAVEPVGGSSRGSSNSSFGRGGGGSGSIASGGGADPWDASSTALRSTNFGSGMGGRGGPMGRVGTYEAGGFVFSLSTIAKVIDVKQGDHEVLLRVQSEGRVVVKSLAQSQPYFRAVVVPLTDAVDLDKMQAPLWRDICGSVERLRSLMRDVQNLASKFKTPETTNLQRAMQWVDNPHPLVFSSSSMLLNSRTAHNFRRNNPTATSFDDFQPSKILSNQIQADNGSPYMDPESISSASESECDVHYAAAAAAGAEPLPPGLAPAPKLGGLTLPGAAAGGTGLAAAAIAGGLNGGVIRSRPSLLDLERACRLSLAAIQVLPQATEEEREAIRRYQAAALETQDVLERLELAVRVMGESRALLSAKCALMALLG